MEFLVMLSAGYLAAAVGMMAMTFREWQRSGQPMTVFSLIGIGACLAWPLLILAMLAWRPAVKEAA
mgnify:CR=1 FL=1